MYISKYVLSSNITYSNLAVDLFLYYLSRILEKGLSEMEEKDFKGSNVQIVEEKSGQMFEKRLQICNVIVQPCAA